jgi:hypothetical protein
MRLLAVEEDVGGADRARTDDLLNAISAFVSSGRLRERAELRPQRDLASCSAPGIQWRVTPRVSPARVFSAPYSSSGADRYRSATPGRMPRIRAAHAGTSARRIRRMTRHYNDLAIEDCVAYIKGSRKDVGERLKAVHDAHGFRGGSVHGLDRYRASRENHRASLRNAMSGRPAIRARVAG